MSDFKFACPVCGQHLTAHGSTSGSQIECPTCFRKIIVPQAPASDSKLIVAAAQPQSGRPISRGADLEPLRRKSGGLAPGLLVLGMLLAVAGAALYSNRGLLARLARRSSILSSGHHTNSGAGSGAPSPQVVWTSDLSRAVIPAQAAGGNIHGQPFACERASLTGGALFLRQGTGWPPDLALSLVLPVKESADLSGRTFEVAPDQGLAHRVLLRWKDGGQGQKREFTNGYALKLSFGQPAAGRMPGKLYLAVGDETRSVVAGTFDAEIKPVRRGP